MKIREDIHALKYKFFIPVKPGLTIERFVYSFLIFGKENVHLIDSGVADSAEAIFNYILEQSRPVNKIKTLILTHSHPDHIGSAKVIKEKSNCEVLAHRNEKDWIEDIQKQFSERPVPGFNTLVNGPVKIDRLVIDGENIVLEEDLTLKVLHTPGHSKGSISLLCERVGVLICADALLLPGGLPIYDNVIEAVNSIKKLKQIAGIKVLLSSWDEPASGAVIGQKMDQSMSYFKTIHKVISEVEDVKNLAPMTLCEKVIDKIGLPPAAVNPLVAKSFQSNVAALDQNIFG